MTRSMLLVLAILFIASPGISQVDKSETLEECVKGKRAELRDEKTETVYTDRGCTTGGTTWDGKRKSCSTDVCWGAPPGRIILNSSATSHSANGSSHSFSGPTYQPDRERAYRVCFHVKAKSKGGMSNSGSRGWQKINMKVTHMRELSEEEVVGLARACIQEGAR